MLHTAFLLVGLSAMGTPTPPPAASPPWGHYHVSGRKLERFAAEECMNPHFRSNTDPVRAARFDSHGTVTAGREASKLGIERVRSLAELWKMTRPTTTIGVSGGWQESRQRQDQFPHRP
jgi:hypothetical protein